MKIATICFLSFLILGSGNAGFLDSLKESFSSIGTAFTSTFGQLGEQAKQVGTALLSTATDAGKQLASQALQSLLLGSMGALSPSTSKRDLHGLLQHFSGLQHEAEQLIETRYGNLQGLFQEAIAKLQQVSSQLGHLQPDQLKTEIEHIIQTHNSLSQHLSDNMVQNLVSIFEKSLVHHSHKKSLADTLSSFGQTLGNLFQPHVDAINQLVSGVGHSLSQSVQTLATSLQNSPHTQAIGESSHTIAQHGVNALNALTDAVTSILHQTLTSIQPHLVNIVQHGASALTESLGGVAASEQ